MLTNPNCEYHPNFVAIHTLATWCRSEGGRVGGQRDVEMSEYLRCYCFTLLLMSYVRQLDVQVTPGQDASLSQGLGPQSIPSAMQRGLAPNPSPECHAERPRPPIHPLSAMQRGLGPQCREANLRMNHNATELN